ncbi:MAG: hypothetical protein LVQ97_05300 [Candidatus Micrarchaeales archaeon]|jgi:hypothetical protein|uniref:Uncharacterized protein n=1 Tax=Candidatus Micrarchaeum acidiphilum ARMAN-2 TaxID=425595 RepID=C7DG66_MICA2|nr:MAG: hypothetical protein UNLARM2_0070 [Candidatus Micrarchaeum acidiphilum ARMAN-2]MCW6161574.1 hypothetical protein [Candidatus Micrarchaeales archaeon]
MATKTESEIKRLQREMITSGKNDLEILPDGKITDIVVSVLRDKIDPDPFGTKSVALADATRATQGLINDIRENYENWSPKLKDAIRTGDHRPLLSEEAQVLTNALDPKSTERLGETGIKTMAAGVNSFMAIPRATTELRMESYQSKIDELRRKGYL